MRYTRVVAKLNWRRNTVDARKDRYGADYYPSDWAHPTDLDTPAPRTRTSSPKSKAKSKSNGGNRRSGTGRTSSPTPAANQPKAQGKRKTELDKAMAKGLAKKRGSGSSWRNPHPSAAWAREDGSLTRGAVPRLPPSVEAQVLPTRPEAVAAAPDTELLDPPTQLTLEERHYLDAWRRLPWLVRTAHRLLILALARVIGGRPPP